MSSDAPWASRSAHEPEMSRRPAVDNRARIAPILRLSATGTPRTPASHTRTNHSSTFVEYRPKFVEKVVDSPGVQTYCPTSALLLRPQHGITAPRQRRTPRAARAGRVTALAMGLGKLDRQRNQLGKTGGRRVRADQAPGAVRR
jgi:hypothetical protein